MADGDVCLWFQYWIEQFDLLTSFTRNIHESRAHVKAFACLAIQLQAA